MMTVRLCYKESGRGRAQICDAKNANTLARKRIPVDHSG